MLRSLTAKHPSQLAPPALLPATPNKGPTPPLPKSPCFQPLVPVADVPVDYDILHKGRQTPKLLPSPLRFYICPDLCPNPNYLPAGTLHWRFLLGGGNGPPRKQKKGTINEVPSRRGLWPAERNIWFSFSALFPGPLSGIHNGPDGRPR